VEANKVVRVNGQFQQWLSLLQNRTKRTQSGSKCIVQGVRPINAVVRQPLEVDTILRKEGALSDWALGILKQTAPAKTYSVSSDLNATGG
jgi:23S rRNA (uridine2479-2'-O)-methyltransferase